MRKIAHNDGWRGFYRGWAATALTFVPAGAVQWMMYEGCRKRIYRLYPSFTELDEETLLPLANQSTPGTLSRHLFIMCVVCMCMCVCVCVCAHLRTRGFSSVDPCCCCCSPRSGLCHMRYRSSPQIHHPSLLRYGGRCDCGRRHQSNGCDQEPPSGARLL
jgi:Mitochondrial carrier protein